jgi:transcriptional regulator with XRE-family HTH domain
MGRPHTPLTQRRLPPLVLTLRHLRVSLGLTQQAVDRRAGLPTGTVTKYETGTITPNLFNLCRWVDGLGAELRPVPKGRAGA